MNPIFLPTACLGLAVACQLKLLRPLPVVVQLLSAIALYLTAIFLFQFVYGWWWAVPYCLAEFMGFGFVLVFSLNAWPKFAVSAAWCLLPFIVLFWLTTPIYLNTVDISS